MAEAAVSFLLDNLTQVLKSKVELIKGVEDEIQILRRHLYSFKAFLKDTAKIRQTNNSHAELVKQMKEVIDIAEDAIDNFIVQEAQHQSKGVFRRLLNSPIHANVKMTLAQEVQKIRDQVDAIEKVKKESSSTQPTAAEYKRTAKKAVLEELDDVVGLDEETKIVIERLKILPEGPEDLQVTTIVGMAGLGKTTLANKIFNHPDIDYEFFTRAWVQVSEQYNVKDIFLNLYFEITKEKPKEDLRNMSNAGIAEEIREKLKGKYFIVLDDVWDTKAYDDIKGAFPDAKKGSRILITSRHLVVGRYANKGTDPHDLKFLTNAESLELLTKKVFGKKQIPDEMIDYGNHIVEKCRGLPLAIVVTAGILLKDPKAKHWWEEVSRDVNKRILLPDRDHDNVEGVRVSVGWSYDNLPYYLKPCFLYFGVFPEDYEIPVWKLIRLWIAEGFIEQQGESSLEETAEESLYELVNRNLVMIGKRRSDGRIKTCKVHDMLFEFCKSRAKEENFYLNDKGSMVKSLEGHRRLCIHSEIAIFNSRGKQLCGDHVRSLLSFEPGQIRLDKSQVSTIPKAFKLLRVLDLRPLLFTLFPRELSKLVLLRYIAMSSNFKALPASMSKLWNIQTIIMDTTEGKLEIKKDLWELEQLRHVITNAPVELHTPPSGGGKAKSWDNVQTLSLVSPESCTESILSKVPYTKKFGVHGRLEILLGIEGNYTFFNNIGNLQYLTNLKLFNHLISDTAHLSKLPEDHMFPKQLSKLTLSETMLPWKEMSILAKLEKLEKLKLKDNAFMGQVWEQKAGGFRSLQVLNIGRTDLKEWKVETPYSFPSLKRLVLQHCDKIQEVPVVLAELRSFQELEIIRTSPQAALSAKKIQELKKKNIKDGQGGLKLSIFPPDLIGFIAN